MNFEQCLDRYARLLVIHGANIQPGQIVNVSGEVAHREFALLVAQEAYKAGASSVILDLAEPRLQKFKLDTVKEEYIGYVPKHVSTKFQQILDDQGATIKLIGPEFPLLLADSDPKRVNAERKAYFQAVKSFYEEGIGKSKVHWTIGAVATPAWAKRVYPELNEKDALSALWQELFKIVRVENDNFLEVWEEHNRKLHLRSETLNKLKIKQIHFKGPGTDLLVGISPRARFKGGTDVGPRGVPFSPNIPTEECFTTPDFRMTSGTVRATRPFLVNGVLIDGLSLVFEKGEIVSFEAKKGSDTFREYISSDIGAKRLGEVALVGVDSPIFRSGRIFEEILLDENAACHIAVGSAYKFCIEGGENLSESEALEIGCNESMVHTDMMISSEEVDVSAILSSGETVEIMKSGEWSREFR
jgi:aminopeptidase